MEKKMAHRKISRSRFSLFVVFVLCTVLFIQSIAKETKNRCNCGEDCSHIIGKIGMVVHERSRVGKQQKVAIQMAIEDYTHHQLSSCSKLALHIQDSYGKSARAAFAAIDLVNKENVQAIIIATTMEEATLLTQFEEVSNANIPIITIGSAAISPPLFHQPSYFFQMNDDIYTRIRCAADIIGHVRWQKVTVIYEQSNNIYSDSRLKSQLLESLKPFNSFIESDIAYPSLASLQEPKAFIQENLKKLKRKNGGIFVLLQSSIEFATIFLENVKKMGLMDKGYAWILCDDVVNLLDSLDSSSRRNMQGIIGFRTNIVDKRKSFQQFKSRFQSKFRLVYPEEEHPTPSMYALRAYEAAIAIAKSMKALEGNMSTRELINHISDTNFEGLCGKISFKNGKLSEDTTFQIINVIEKSYKNIAFWSSKHGFSTHLASICWPGDEQTSPKGPQFIIGVPAMPPFDQFVDVSYDRVQNRTISKGFALEVFEGAVGLLPTHFPYIFFSFNGTYDEMVEAVSNKTLDGAVGDMNILEHRYELVDFTASYLDSQIVIVTPAQKDLEGSGFIGFEPFHWKLWAVLATLSQCTSAIIYFNEKVNGNIEFAHPFPQMICSILWLSVTILTFSHKEPIESNLSRLVIAAWSIVIVVVAASYTAVLSSMMTVPRLKPVVVDIDYLRSTNATIGCNGKGFIANYLVQTLRFRDENIKKFDSDRDYPKAFESGEIAVAFLISPHARVFVAKYKRYVVAKPSFEVGGLSFAFQKGSPLTKDISKAILNMKENGAIKKFEAKIFPALARSLSSEGDDKLSLSVDQFLALLEFSIAIDAVVLGILVKRAINRGCPIHGYIYSWLTQRRVWRWTLVFLSRRFGSRFFRAHVIHRQNNQMYSQTREDTRTRS